MGHATGTSRSLSTFAPQKTTPCNSCPAAESFQLQQILVRNCVSDLQAQNGALQTQNGSLQAQNGMLQIQIGGLRTRLLDCEARLRRAPIPAELKRLVREDVNRVMRDPNLGCGTRSHTVRALLQGWHAGEPHLASN